MDDSFVNDDWSPVINPGACCSQAGSMKWLGVLLLPLDVRLPRTFCHVDLTIEKFIIFFLKIPHPFFYFPNQWSSIPRHFVVCRTCYTFYTAFHEGQFCNGSVCKRQSFLSNQKLARALTSKYSESNRASKYVMLHSNCPGSTGTCSPDCATQVSIH